MSIKILEETFQSATASAAEVGEWYASKINGIVEVDLGRGNAVTAWAIKHDSGSLSVLGFCGRYVQGSKTWRASVTMNTINGARSLWAWFGRDDRSGRFNKMNCIFWSPETYFAI